MNYSFDIIDGKEGNTNKLTTKTNLIGPSFLQLILVLYR